jgi:glycosyltransferase involved in cell wall biosynthesis
MSGGRPVAVAWSLFQARTESLATAIGGTPLFVAGDRMRASTLLLPLRYVRDAITTWLAFRRAQPSVVLVITPPVFAPLTAFLWCALHRRPMVIDCHTTALHSRKWGWALPVHRLLMWRAQAVIVHTEEAEAEVKGWTPRVVLVPDDLPEPVSILPQRSDTRASVLVAGSLDSGEPLRQTLEAARLIPEVAVRLTGDPERVPVAVRASAPPNAVFTGWLEYPRFLAELMTAEVVAAFSTDPGIMNRAAFEAVALGRPLVLTDLPGLRRRFGEAALFTPNDPPAMARTLRKAIEERVELAERSRRLQARLRADRAQALDHLRALMTLPSGKPQRRVLIVSQHPYPDAPLLRRNVEHLAAQGVQLDVVCMKSLSSRALAEVPRQVRMITLPVKHQRAHRLNYLVEYVAFFALALPIVSALGLRHRYRTVQVDNLPDFLAFAALIPRMRGARLVLYIYDLLPEMTMTRLRLQPRHWLVRLARRIEQSSVRWVDHVITVSEGFRRLLIERGADPQKVSVVYNTQPLATQRRQAAEGGPLLITHATLVQRYGVQVAVQALPYLRTAWPSLRYEILGRGEYRPALERLAVELGVDDIVGFPGFLPWRQAMDRISRANVGIVPVIADGFGELILPMKLLEYVGIGVPVACARLPGIEEHFPEDALAYFAPGDPHDLARQVERLLRDPEGAQRQAERALVALEGIRWEAVSPRYLAALGTPA